jgi:hypothetical protein
VSVRTVPWFHWRRGLIELTLMAGLYVAYSASRMLASDAFAPARERAAKLLDVEDALGIAWEATINQWFVVDHALAVFGSFWYASTHYVVTLGMLIWLYFQGPEKYLPARRALIVATLLGLAAYLLLPTAPPRLFGGYVDVLNLTQADGWWGADASAPKGLGSWTNELAAFPSLHAGWALWAAIVLQRFAKWRTVKVAAWLYAAMMAFVIVGTGNHWVLDAITGWLVVLVGFAATRWWTRRAVPAPPAPEPDPSSSTSAAG